MHPNMQDLGMKSQEEMISHSNREPLALRLDTLSELMGRSTFTTGDVSPMERLLISVAMLSSKEQLERFTFSHCCLAVTTKSWILTTPPTPLSAHALPISLDFSTTRLFGSSVEITHLTTLPREHTLITLDSTLQAD